MSRLLVALALLAGACAPNGHYHHHCHGFGSRGYGPPSKVDGALALGELAVGAIALGAALTDTMSDPPAPPPPPPRRRLFGTVSWAEGGRVAGVKVVLEAGTGFVKLDTTTDEGGRFWFPWPLPADMYRISVEDERAAGEKTLWLGQRRPSYLDLEVTPSEPPSD